MSLRFRLLPLVLSLPMAANAVETDRSAGTRTPIEPPTRVSAALRARMLAQNNTAIPQVPAEAGAAAAAPRRQADGSIS